MSGITWTTWVWWLGGAALLVISLGLLLWALFWDRARGRKRCPRCWYDMSAAPAPGLTCSECGKVVARERKLLKTRRRKRWALIALIGIIGAGYLAVQPRVKEKGWWSLVPTRVLIAGLPFASGIDDFWCHELACRIEAGTGIRSARFTPSDGRSREPMTQEEWAQFFDACVAGDWFASPIDGAWQRKYGELLEVWRDGSFHMPSPGGKAEEHRLLGLPVSFDARTRDPWPTNVTPVIQCDFLCWWPDDVLCAARVTPRDAEIEPFTVHRGRPTFITLPVFDETERAFTFDVTFERRQRGQQRINWEAFGEQVKTVTVQRDGLAESHLTPFEPASLTGALQGTCRYELHVSGDSMSGMVIHSAPFTLPRYDGIAFGFYVDVLRNGEVVASTAYWVRGGPDRQLNLNHDEFVRGLQTLRSLPAQGDWTLRFRSDREIALRILDAEQFWEGEFTIPATLVVLP